MTVVDVNSTIGYPESPASILSPSLNSRRLPNKSTKSINWEDAFQEVGSVHTNKVVLVSLISRTQPGVISSAPSPLDARKKISDLLRSHVARGDSSILLSSAQAPPITAIATTKASISRLIPASLMRFDGYIRGVLGFFDGSEVAATVTVKCTINTPCNIPLTAFLPACAR